MEARIYFCLMIALNLQIVLNGQTIEIKDICETIYTDKYPNSNNNLIVRNNLLFSVNERSFSILQVKNEQFFKLSDLNLEGQLQSVDILNNFAFVATSPPVDRVYKIDISDLNNPSVIDTLCIRGSYTGFTFHENYCVNELSRNKNWMLQIYDTLGFKVIKSIQVPHNKWPLRKLTEDIDGCDKNNASSLFLILHSCGLYG